jgi:hypothetical protein
MKCERCGAPMREEQVTVSGGLVKLKNVLAWHCTVCERVEYGTLPSVVPAANRPPVTAYNSSGLENSASNEVSKSIY